MPSSDVPREPASPQPESSSSSLTVLVHSQTLQQLPKEHIEALVEDTVQIWRLRPDRQDTLVAINARRIAVLLNKRAHRGAVLPVEFIEQKLESTTRTELQTWLASPQTRFFETRIPGDWFASFDVESSRTDLVDSGSGYANMTYDTGPRPRE